MATPLKAYSRARPVRVAFLVDDHQHSSVMLDAIFRDCMGRWGGRFSLLVPATASGPKESYLNWLEAFDPDIIYSYVDLDDAVIERLQERFYPSFLIRHNLSWQKERDARAFWPKLPIDCLKVTSLIPMATLPTILNGSRNGRFLDAMGRMHNTPFIQDSFGFFTECVGRGYSEPLNEFGSPVTMVADEDCQPRERYLRNAETVSSVYEFLDFACKKSFISMSQLSAMVTPRLDIGSWQWGNSFNVVVGDSYTDRLVYWNARLLYPKWRDREFVDLRIPSSYLNDTNAIEAIGKFITRHNRVSSLHESSNPRVTIRSNSIAADALEIFGKALKGSSSWLQYEVKSFSNTDDCLPTSEELENASFTAAENFMARAASLWSETYISDEKVEINPPAPEPLKYCPAHLQSYHEGTWAIDVDIDRKANHSLISNIHHRWRFPKRLRILRSFLKGYEISSPSASLMMPRVESGGLLTVYANVASKPISINLPDDEDAIGGAFISGRDWWPFVRKSGEQMPAQLLKDIRRSPNGRYFAGTLGIFETLNEANNILMHRFWREQLAKLGASPLGAERNREEVQAALIKRLGGANGDLVIARDITKLTDIVLTEADKYRTTIPCVSWNDLERDFTSLQNKDWKLNPPQDGESAQHEESKENEIRLFKRGLQSLCEKGVLYQGYEHKCSKCLHHSWFAISNLKTYIQCEVCSNREPAPVDRPWQFRLNEFLREALRKHGVWPLFWTLSRLRNHQESSFYFAGPLDVYVNGNRWDNKSDTDVDLTIVSDGLVRMCEVKQSERKLNPTIVQNFAKLMLRLRPDIATLAVMEPETANLRALFNQFSKLLDGSGVRPELLTLKHEDFSDSPSFYGITRVRIF